MFFFPVNSSDITGCHPTNDLLGEVLLFVENLGWYSVYKFVIRSYVYILYTEYDCITILCIEKVTRATKYSNYHWYIFVYMYTYINYQPDLIIPKESSGKPTG